MINNVLKAKKRKDIIEEILNSKEDFVNRDFLRMIIRLHPKKITSVMSAIEMAANHNHFDVCRAAGELFESGMAGPFHGIPALHSAFYLLKFAGVNKSLLRVYHSEGKRSDPKSVSFYYLKLKETAKTTRG